MSLINEALKRADAQKERPPEQPQATPPVATTPGATTPAATTPAATTPVATTPVATTPAATTPAVLPRRRSGLRMAVLAGAAVVLGAVALGWYWQDRGGAGPQQATAAGAQDAVAPQSPGARQSPQKKSVTPASPAGPVARAARVPRAAEKATPVVETTEAPPDTAKGGGIRAELWADVPDYGLTAADAVEEGGALTPGGSSSEAMAGDLDALAVGDTAPSGAAPEMAIGLAPLSIGAGSDKPAASDAPPRLGAERPKTPAPAAKPGTADAPRAAKDAFDPSKYRVSSIVVSAAGGTALVSGRPVRVGDTLGGATVVAITARAVEVECDGQRWTLRM